MTVECAVPRIHPSQGKILGAVKGLFPTGGFVNLHSIHIKSDESSGGVTCESNMMPFAIVVTGVGVDECFRPSHAGGDDAIAHHRDAEVIDHSGDLAVDQSGSQEPSRIAVSSSAEARGAHPEGYGEVLLDLVRDACAFSSLGVSGVSTLRVFLLRQANRGDTQLLGGRAKRSEFAYVERNFRTLKMKKPALNNQTGRRRAKVY